MQKNNQLTEEEQIREERNFYFREYRRKNRKKIHVSQKKWRDDNPEKIAGYNRKYWLKKAEERRAK